MGANTRHPRALRPEYEHSQLVVETAHRDEVVADLATLGIIPVGTPKEEPRLGLTLLDLPDLGGVMPALRADQDLVDKVMDIRRRRLPAGVAQLPPDDLDLLLSKLRFMTPRPRTVGKNRFVDDLETLGEINGGGSKPPRMLDHLERLLPDPGHDSPRPAGRGIRIGVIDTAVYEHRDFGGRHLDPAPLVWKPPACEEHRAAHATMGVGIILQLAPEAELVTKKALDEGGEATAWSIAAVMADFLDDPVDILHMPCGGVTQDSEVPLLLERAVDRLVSEHGTVIVAAAGNLGESTNPLAGPLSPVWPAALPEVVAVAAVDAAGDRPPFSADPEALTWVDLSALGAAVPTTYPDHEFACAAGTSFAAANVTGLLAALASGAGGSLRTAMDQLRDMPARSRGTGSSC